MPKKKSIKKLTPTPESDSERETRVLLEEVRSDVKKIAEGHSLLITNQEELKSELETVKVAVMEIDTGLKKVEQRTDRIEQKLDTIITDHEQRLQKLEATH